MRRRRRHRSRLAAFFPAVAAGALLAMLHGCHQEHRQSALHPAGPAAERIADLWWLMLAVLGGVFLVTMLLALVAILRHRRSSEPGRPVGQWFIVAGGIVLPAVILVGLLIASLFTTVGLHPPGEPVTIRVTGHQWWWEVEYPEQGIVTANELHIPVGRPVRLELKTADVIHSFWTPNLHGKMDLLPELTNTLVLQASRPGVFRGQCAEYCGIQHAWMAFEVVALAEEDFVAWVEARQQQSPDPTEPLAARGREVFTTAGCNTCHTVRGEKAEGEVGPDLTHIGSRRTIGAGLLPNNKGNLTGWVANPQALKPGNKMPRSYLESEDLHAVVEYLRSLQ